LEIAALSLNFKSDDEIIVPSFSFITTGSSFERTGARIVYLDIERSTCMPSIGHFILFQSL
jgi:dTDP-4-amino-4,6-dideoxygalactose transaminase